MFACMYVVSLRGASGVGSLGQQFAPALRVARAAPAVHAASAFRAAPSIRGSFTKRFLAPAMCGGNLRQSFAVCAGTGFGTSTKKGKGKSKKKSGGKKQWWEEVNTERAQIAIRAALGGGIGVKRWEDLAKKWKEAAQSTTETGFLTKFQNQQSKEQAKSTAEFTRRQADEAAANGLKEVAKAWEANAKAWEDAAKIMEGVAAQGWSAEAARDIGKAVAETGRLVAAAGEKYEGAAAAFTETEKEFQTAESKLPKLEVLVGPGEEKEGAETTGVSAENRKERRKMQKKKDEEKTGWQPLEELMELPIRTVPNIISIPFLIPIGLFVGSGITFTVLRSGRSFSH